MRKGSRPYRKFRGPSRTIPGLEVFKEFWVRILSHPKIFPFGITLMVSEVFDELMQVTPGAASVSESCSGLYSVICLLEWLTPGSQKVKGGRV